MLPTVEFRYDEKEYHFISRIQKIGNWTAKTLPDLAKKSFPDRHKQALAVFESAYERLTPRQSPDEQSADQSESGQSAHL